MNAKRVLKGCLLVVLLSLVTLLLVARFVLPRVSEELTKRASELGITQLQWEWSWPGLSTATLHTLSFQFQKSGSLTDLAIGSATLHYDATTPRSFLKRIALHNVTAKRPLGAAQIQVSASDLAVVPASNGDWVMESPVTIEIMIDGSPIPIRATSARVQLIESKIIKVISAQSEVVGAKLTLANPIQWVQDRPTKLRINVQNLDVGAAVAFYGSPDLVATGMLSGSFDAKLSSTGFETGEGVLDANASGGIVQYKGSAFESAPAAVSSPLQALRDFRYSSARVSISAKSTGDVTLALHLNGSNPNWQSGRPVELNLNIEDNVLQLSKSLRLAKGNFNE